MDSHALTKFFSPLCRIASSPSVCIKSNSDSFTRRLTQLMSHSFGNSQYRTGSTDIPSAHPNYFPNVQLNPYGPQHCCACAHRCACTRPMEQLPPLQEFSTRNEVKTGLASYLSVGTPQSRPGTIVTESSRRFFAMQHVDRAITHYDAAIANLIKVSTSL